MKVLVGVSKDPESQIALAYACHLLEHVDAEVHALYVSPDEVETAADTFYAPFFSTEGLKEWIDSETLEVRDQVLSQCQYCLAGKVPCLPFVTSGDPAEKLLEHAQDGQYDMIVLGSHGQSALKGFLLGAVHAKVLHHAKISVLLVRDFRRIERVLVAYRGSQCDQRALQFTGKFLERRKPKITLMHVQEIGGKEDDKAAEACVLDGKATISRFGHDAAVKLVTGDFVDEITREVRVGLYDLVVLGGYGNERPRYLGFLSDEALNLVRSTTRPVLIYKD